MWRSVREGYSISLLADVPTLLKSINLIFGASGGSSFLHSSHMHGLEEPPSFGASDTLGMGFAFMRSIMSLATNSTSCGLERQSVQRSLALLMSRVPSGWSANHSGCVEPCSAH